MRFHSHLSALLKTLISFQNIILFSKILRSFAAQEHMKITLEKKFNNVCDLLAPVRFQSHLSALLTTLISFEKYLTPIQSD